jgi:hypothetical protein
VPWGMINRRRGSAVTPDDPRRSIAATSTGAAFRAGSNGQMIRIGARHGSSPTLGFTGTIDEAVFYPTALSSARIATHAPTVLT